MKRILFIGLILLVSGCYLNAQTKGRAIGVRISFAQDEKSYAGGELSFQKDVRKRGRWENDIGFWSSTQWNAFKFTTMRHWKFVNLERFHVYAGPGLGVGIVTYPYATNEFFSSANADIGLDYTFGFPIQIALNWRPEWTIINNFGTPLGWDVGFAVRFAF